MRSAFGSKNASDFGFGAEFDREAASSPDQLSAVWNSIGEVVAASPLVGGIPGSFGMDVARYQSEFELSSGINAKRTRDLKLPPLSQATQFLTTTNEFSERTRILALDGERLSLDDEELLEWLINAERQMTLGTDNHPVFETSLEDTACGVRRLPNGYVSMTEVPRHHVQALGVKMRSVTGGALGTGSRLTIETPLRCAARYFLTITDLGQRVMRPSKASEVTAFIVLTSAGYSFGLWSPLAGIFTEYAFLAPDEVKAKSRGIDPAGKGSDRAIDAYIQQAFDQLLLQMSQDKLESLQLSNYAQVVWGAERGLDQIVSSVAVAFAAKTGLEFIPLDIAVDEAAAEGLLLGSYNFGDASIKGADILPPINLAHDLLVEANTGEIERRREEEARIQARKNKAFVTLMAAPAIAAAFIVAMVANLLVSWLMVSWRDARADARTEELKPALERRKSYEANLKWYQEFIKEVSKLRRQQPVGIELLYQLNEKYPSSSTFFVSGMKLEKTGDIEIKGLSKSKDEVASLLKAMEFASGAESGSRLFSDLAYEIQETVPATATLQKPAAIPGSTLADVPGSGPGIVRWSIKGKYRPVVDFTPPAAPAVPAGATPAASPGATPPTTTAQTSGPLPCGPASPASGNKAPGA